MVSLSSVYAEVTRPMYQVISGDKIKIPTDLNNIDINYSGILHIRRPKFIPGQSLVLAFSSSSSSISLRSTDPGELQLPIDEIRAEDGGAVVTVVIPPCALALYSSAMTRAR